MKLAKMTGLAATAAICLFALVGATPASASLTVLCKTSTESPNCKTENIRLGGVVKATSSNATIAGRFLGFNGTIQCSESTLEGKASTGGEPLSVSISSWSLGGCKTSFSGTCTAATEGAPYSGSLSWVSGSNGALKLASSPGWNFKCGGFPNVSCTLSFSSTLDMNGGNPATIVASAEPMSGTGSNCPEKTQPITFSATYSVTSPAPAYVAKPTTFSGETILCSELPGPCPAAHVYPAGTAINAESGNFSIVTDSGPMGTITCSQATIAAETTASRGTPLPINMSMPLKGCFSSGVGGSSCASPTAISGTSSLNRLAGIDGVWLPKTVGWRFNCAGFPTLICTYYMDGTQTMMLEGGLTAPVAVVKEASLKIIEEGSLSCGTSAKVTATYNVTSPIPLAVTS